MTIQTVLIVEDALPTAMIYQKIATKGGYMCKIAQTAEDALTVIRRDNPDVILLDLELPDGNGLDVLKDIKIMRAPCDVVVITSKTSINNAIAAIQMGAVDFISKPIDEDRLNITLNNIFNNRKLNKIVNNYERTNRTSFCNFIGGSQEMKSVYNIIESAAQSNASVMITGENGTGKELAAHAIHIQSLRRNENLISINCAAIPADLLESEVFGHVKGAFTGAINDREGAAKRAHNGTLFLDELAEMPIALQSKLLRFIQTGEYTPVGSNKTLQANIRFVCATNRDPIHAIKNNVLREDLYYRLAVIPIQLPPLRQREDDIIQLGDHFLEKCSKEEKKSFKVFDNAARKLLKSHRWPGNVRELENCIRRAVIMNDGICITGEMLSHLVNDNLSAKDKFESFNFIEGKEIFQTPENIMPLKIFEKLIIKDAIRVCNGNVSEAARLLKTSQSNIYRKQ